MTTAPSTKFVVSLRVSTQKQGADGLGVAAQRRDIELFLNQQQEPEVLAELVEVESGAASDRPVLESALALLQKAQSDTAGAKVDRLSRDLELLARLLKDKAVPVKVAQLPNADNFQLHLFAWLSCSQEREFISA